MQDKKFATSIGVLNLLDRGWTMYPLRSGSGEYFLMPESMKTTNSINVPMEVVMLLEEADKLEPFVFSKKITDWLPCYRKKKCVN